MKLHPTSHAMTAALIGILTVTLMACSKVPDTAQPPLPSTTVGTEIDDGIMTSRVKAALLADPSIRSLNFQVETRKGEVQISGFADSQTQIDQVATLARAVPGVKGVTNNVSLKGGANTLGAVVEDIDITARIKMALLNNTEVKSLAITVVTRQGDVQLSGFVDNQKQIDLATEIAKRIYGVRSVNAKMIIKQ